IKPEAYKSFCLAVHERLLDLCVRRLICDAVLLEAERRLRRAQDSFTALSAEQRQRIGLGFVVDWTSLIPKMLENISKLTESALYRPNEPTKRGPRRERSNWVLRELVRDLWRIARAHGGDFTLWADERGGAKGTMVEALRQLKPILPPGLVPHVLPRTTLNRLRPDHRLRKIKN